ncbi:SusC/RagA family TonB-linked outer membrane protein [Flammeovirga aprica]|uniref:TonB-dependent receptor n=1 Tax=Flammeovirga aprica JL-4 TaxID=694437 RepID=A0A7X9RWL3_9BACT|nr:TonB-dependent receptor [Flammeovirga aprica]NME70065.1 TonB-dependent receptor [Flammeovirga aprica JL-4]
MNKKLYSVYSGKWNETRKDVLTSTCAFLFLLLYLPAQSFAQNRIISGKVTDQQTKAPLPGVNVVIDGTRNGTITNIDGVFKIEIAGENTNLKFTYVGYEEVVIPVGSSNTLDVTLQEDLEQLDEVVVIGYGYQKKTDVTGAVSTVEADELVKRDVATVGQALQGQMAGVTVTQGSGTPGSSPNISIRGLGSLNNTSPLYVVDGMMLDDISHINSKDIESLQVLKDASASAIYGSRGANGVVIITTKKGEDGHKSINFGVYTGFQNFGNTPRLTNASEWAMLNNEAMLASGKAPLYPNPEALGEGTDWLSEISRTNAPIQNYDLSFTSGNDVSTFFISGQYFSQEGVIKKTNYDRLSLRVNSEHKMTKFLKVGENITLTRSNQSTILEGDEWNNLLITPLNMEPTTPVYNEDGTYAASNNQVRNPVAAVDNTFDTGESFRVLANVYADLSLLKGLTFKTNLGTNFSFDEDQDYNPIYFVSNTDRNDINSLFKGNNRAQTVVWSNTLNYNHKIGNHSFDALAGTEYYDEKQEWYGLTTSDFPSDNEDNRVVDNSRNSHQAQTYGSFFENRQISYLGRLNYSYGEKYLLTANFRADGSSKFGSKHKWGYFPSFSAGWRLNEENFLKSTDWLSHLKLRAGWGQIGNQAAIPAYTQSTVATAGLNYVLGYPSSVVSGSAFQGLGNDEVKWETVESTNVGVEFGILEGRLSGSAEYYIKNTTDMLLTPPVPGQTGLENAPWQNTGEMENKGIEIVLKWEDYINDNLKYSIGGNFTTIQNRVVSLGSASQIDDGEFRSSGFVNRTVVGRPISNFYGLVAEGLFQNQAEIDAYYANFESVPANVKPGDIRYRDADGNGEYDYDFIGSPIPEITYAIHGGVSYKGIDFSFLLNGVYGIEVYNGPGYYQLSSRAYWNTAKERLNRWTGEGSTNDPRNARMVDDDSQNTRISSRYVEDASFLRISNVQIGYSFPQSILERAKINSLRVYASGQNLYTFTKYTGYDPEVGGYGTSIGLDRATYPVPRTITFGLNLGF